MNRQRATRFGWLAVGALAAVSCSVPKTHYYVLEYPHTPPEAAPRVSRQIAVQPFRSNQVFSEERIAYRAGENQVNFYEYHRWANQPGELVTNYFIHRLRDSGLYAGVSTAKEGPPADFIVQGRILHFEEIDRGKEVSASVALELELMNGKTRASAWRSEAQCSKPLATRDMAGVTQGIHFCLDETATKLLGEMYTQIEQSARP
jgi:ABC-type uncharacterized transport system auxiliary subunit